MENSVKACGNQLKFYGCCLSRHGHYTVAESSFLPEETQQFEVNLTRMGIADDGSMSLIGI
jgi:hypothetical protein